MVSRYKIQQDKGQYCLKGCDDGDLVDYSEYAAVLERALNADRRLALLNNDFITTTIEGIND